LRSITNLLLLASLVAIVGFYIVAMRMSGDALHVGPITVSRMQLNLIVGFGAVPTWRCSSTIEA